MVRRVSCLLRISAFERMAIVVLDCGGIRAMLDAHADMGRDTLGHIAERRGLRVSNHARLGLANHGCPANAQLVSSN